MTDFVLTKTRLSGGIWQGTLTGAASDKPQLYIIHQGDRVDGLQLTQGEDSDVWQISVPIPMQLIEDGVQTFLITDYQENVLNSFVILSGEALAEDIRAEVSQLRSELDMLKQAFRRHCTEG